ncbi:hypothetical protein ACQEVS_11115 [Streptomyces sp. CA-181903]|uniref:hypothetical protein n=1 Tax=Streptomyces sp. CA-181903 TaxID=3240055 RepID=UPI003D9048C7
MPGPTLRELRGLLAHLVFLVVECPEEPCDGDLRPGDVALRFRPLGPLDGSGLDPVVEVRSKWSASRAAHRQERGDRLCAGVRSASGSRNVGVYLSLPAATWAPGD